MAERAVAQAPAVTQSRDRWLRVLAVAIAAGALVLCAAALVLHAVYVRRGVDVRVPHAADLVLGALFPLAGAVVLWRQPRNPAGWVLMSAALVSVSVLAHEWAYDGGVADPGSLPWVPAAVWFSAWTYIPYWVQPTLLPLLFPDGRLPSPRWGRFVRVVLCLVAVLTFAAMFKVDEDVETFGMHNPLGLSFLPAALDAVWPVLQYGTVMLLWLVGAPIALIGMVQRLRRSTGRERSQLLWLLLGFLGTPLLFLVSLAVPQLPDEAILAVGFACIPLALAVAVLRHQMLDVEVVANRTVVYGLLSAAGLAAYFASATLVSRYAGAEGEGPLLAAAVVVVAAALRTRLQRWVDRRLFGARRDPYAVVQQVGASTAEAAAPDEALQALVETVRAALRLPFVQLLDEQGEVVSEAGAPAVGTHVLPLVDRGRRRGVLVIGKRSKGERLRPAEESALTDVARRAAALLSAQQLTADLQRSYAQAVLAREEERRRLRRDLHDGIGPSLAGMALQLDSLAGRLAEPDLAERTERLRDRLQGTVTEVRRIVDGLRPAALDELGLVPALQALATQPGDPVHVTVETDAVPAELPAAVEVAAYRIASEAVANALRHGRATRVQVRLAAADRALAVTVQDDGGGFGAEATAGIGLRSMHDRAAEVGGSLDVQSAPGSGTTVAARLPL